jgi:hypothetical protein
MPSRKRRSDRHIVYTCTICPDWSNGNRRAANDHVWSRHPPRDTPSSSSTPTPPARQSMLSSMWTPTASADAMRNAFDPQRYREAIVGLLTSRRVPFSAVEWDEMRELALACNPHISDKLITSRRKGVQAIVANYDLYSNQIKSSLATACSPIHIATDRWTSPHRHAMLAVCAQWVDKDYKLQKALLGLQSVGTTIQRAAGKACCCGGSASDTDR